jgi:hypothetical protein
MEPLFDFIEYASRKDAKAPSKKPIFIFSLRLGVRLS